MINANELRIGNYLYFNGILEKIDLDSFHGMATYDCLDSYEPIPLTEEWLLKFGFELKKFYEKKYPSKVGFIRKYTKKNLSFSVSKEGVVYYNFKHLLIESVHQLQNLYFALTQTELELR